jgi:lysophospholipase
MEAFMNERISQINFLGEDDFLPAMENDICPFLEEHTRRGQLTSFDNTRLNYYVITPDSPIASLTFVHGMAEFFGKYHEYIYYLVRAGYKVFFMEQRCHGYSEGKVEEHDLVYVDRYDTYVEDLRRFADEVVTPGSVGLKKLIFAHSMGGAVSALFLEEYPDYYDAALLSSPMFKMKSDNFSPLSVFGLSVYSALSGKKKKLSPGQKHFNPDVKLEDGSAKSRPRFEYQLNMRRGDKHYQTSSASLGWAVASLKATRKLIKNAGRIKLPINIMTAGEDHLISPEGYKEFAKRVPQAVFHDYPDSRHEIFNALEKTRKQYFSDVFSILDDYVSAESTK